MFEDKDAICGGCGNYLEDCDCPMDDLYKSQEELMADALLKNRDQDYINRQVKKLLDEEGEFEPGLHGDILNAMISKMSRIWADQASVIGKILKVAHKKHFTGAKQEFEYWVNKKLRMSYQTAMFYIKVGEWSDDIIQLIKRVDFTSTHVKFLPKLKHDFAVKDFLEKEEHIIDFSGTKKKTDKMSAKDVQSAIKVMFKEEEPEETNEEKFLNAIHKISKFLTDNYADFRLDIFENKIKEGEFTSEQIVAIRNLSVALAHFSNDYTEAIKEKFTEDIDE